MPTSPELRGLRKKQLELEQERLHRLKFSRFDFIFPDKGKFRRELYAKHMGFFAAGAKYMTRTLSGGNKVGKTEGCAYEFSAHATGAYPDWWEGKRFSRPISMLACGTEGKKARESIQLKLLGWPGGDMGTGLIPKDRLLLNKCRLGQSASNLFESIFVRNRDGYENAINILTYKAGREAFEATDRDIIWEDEEPDELIHNENVTRLMVREGILMLSYTPLKGLTILTKELIKRGNDQDDQEAWYGRITWDDVPHITPAMIERFKKEYKQHEMAARRYGIPKMGSGAIFTRPWDEVSIPPIRLPDWWPRFYAMDFGYKHPTACLWFAWDRENDVMYVYSEHRVAEAKMTEHVIAVQARGKWVRGAADHNASIEDGKLILDKYNALGLHLVAAKKGEEFGLLEIRDRLATDRLKFFTTLTKTQEEYETYHTDEKGKIYALDDDLMSALRMGVTTGPEIAKTRPPKRVAVNRVKPIKFSERKLY